MLYPIELGVRLAKSVGIKPFRDEQHSQQTPWNVHILHYSVSFAIDSVSRSVSRERRADALVVLLVTPMVTQR